MERTDHEPANSRFVGTNSYPLLAQKWITDPVFHARDSRKEILFLMAASIPELTSLAGRFPVCVGGLTHPLSSDRLVELAAASAATHAPSTAVS